MLAHVEEARLIVSAINVRARELGHADDLVDLQWAGLVRGRISIQKPDAFRNGDDEAEAQGFARGLLPVGSRFAGERTSDVYWGEILDGAAKLVFAQEWARAEEDAGRTYPGQNIYDVMPTAIPDEAMVEAGIILGRVEAANATTLCEAWLRVRNEELGSPEAITAFENGEHELNGNDRFSPERFGECLVYEAVGDGVSWEDDFASHKLDVPSYEVVLGSLEVEPSTPRL